MPVYVDNFDHPFGNMLMSHMIADTTEELLEMVDKIKVRRKWIQDAGTKYEHFDICISKKEKAIKFGAVLITYRQLGAITSKRKDNKDPIINPVAKQTLF